MSISEAMAEAYAALPADVRIYETIELDHVTFDDPIRLVTGVTEAMSFPLTAGGDPVEFLPTAMRITRPGVDESGPSEAQLRIDNVSGALVPYLQAAILADAPVTLIYRAYSSAEPDAPGDIITGLQLAVVDLDATSASGTLRYREIELQAFPLATYDATFYPALQET